MERAERHGARLSAPCHRYVGAVSRVMIASLMLLTWIPAAADNPESDDVLQEVNSPPSIDVPDYQMAVWKVPTMFKATCTDLDATDQLLLTWNWGDGTLSVTDHQSNGGNLTALTAHTYNFRQYYNITVWIDDQSGLPGHNVSDQGLAASLPIARRPPVIVSFTVDALAPMIGQRVTFSATVTDPHLDPCTVAFEFGDGTSTEVSQLLPDSTVNAQHIYQATGVFSAFVYAFDGSLLSWPSAPMAIEVIQASFSLALVHGWNLVSVPLVGFGYRASTLGLLTDDVVSGWNSSSMTYDENFIVNGSPARKDFAIAEGTGFWIYVNVPETLLLSGSVPTTTQTINITVPVGGGWALIAFLGLSTTRHASDIPEMYSGGSVMTVAAYTPGKYIVFVYGVPRTDFLLVPGQGYWIWCTASGTLTYDP